MSTFIDLTGIRFGRLVVVRRASNDKKGNARWVCVCDCGNETTVLSYNLTSGKIKSCGCLRKDVANHLTHGETHTRLFNTWRSIKQRCYNPKNPAYKYYGARNIKMYDEWQSNYAIFRDWAIASGYNDNLTIDRIDVNGNYEPLNCRWITINEQQRNRRNNKPITYMGETHCLTEWAEILKFPYGCLYSRLRYGWSLEKTFSTPSLKRGQRG